MPDGFVRDPVQGYDRDPSTGHLQSLNFTIERALFGSTMLEMDFRGSKGTHLIRRYDFNQPYRTAESFIGGEGFLRPFPEWNAIQIFDTGSNSNYNAFNVSWRQRSRGGLFCESTTRSPRQSTMPRKRTAVRGRLRASPGFAQPAAGPRAVRLGPAARVHDGGQLPAAVRQGSRWGKGWTQVANAVLGGWQLSGTAAAYTGVSLTVTTANPAINLGESLQPNRLVNGKVSAGSGSGKKGTDFPWYDLNAFQAVPSCVELESNAFDCGVQEGGFTPFAFGNWGRNILDGPGLVSINGGLTKDFVLKEGHRLQVRLQAFNVANRTNFIIQRKMQPYNAPSGGLLSAVGNVGRGGGPRVWYYALKYRF